MEKQKKTKLTEVEVIELDRYEEIDDYLSFLNPLTRKLAENQVIVKDKTIRKYLKQQVRTMFGSEWFNFNYLNDLS